MERQMIFAGFGGQGILLMGQLTAYSGMLSGMEVSWIPAYGAEMRGGSCNCSVVLSDEPVGSPMVSGADAVIAMNRLSMDIFEKALKPGGLLMVNGSLIDAEPSRADARVRKIPCNDIAGSLGNARVANVVMLGALLAIDPLFPTETLMLALREKLGKAKEGLIPVNERALRLGFEAGAALGA